MRTLDAHCWLQAPAAGQGGRRGVRHRGSKAPKSLETRGCALRRRPMLECVSASNTLGPQEPAAKCMQHSLTPPPRDRQPGAFRTQLVSATFKYTSCLTRTKWQGPVPLLGRGPKFKNQRKSSTEDRYEDVPNHAIWKLSQWPPKVDGLEHIAGDSRTAKTRHAATRRKQSPTLAVTGMNLATHYRAKEGRHKRTQPVTPCIGSSSGGKCICGVRSQGSG